MHVARERQRDEKDAQRDRVKPPAGQLARPQQVVGKHGGQQLAGRMGQKAAAPGTGRDQVMLLAESPYDAAETPHDGARHAFRQQAGRKDQPQRRQRDAVAEYVLRRASHAHRPRADTLEPGKAHADEYQQQQRVLDQREVEVMLENRVNVVREEDVDVQRHVLSLEIDERLGPSDDDQQEPAQREARVHVSQQLVAPPDFAVQQRLARDLAQRAQRGARRKRPEKHAPLRGFEFHEPQDVFVQQGDQQKQGSQPEWQYEQSEMFHRFDLPRRRLRTPALRLPDFFRTNIFCFTTVLLTNLSPAESLFRLRSAAHRSLRYPRQDGLFRFGAVRTVGKTASVAPATLVSSRPTVRPAPSSASGPVAGY